MTKLLANTNNNLLLKKSTKSILMALVILSIFINLFGCGKQAPEPSPSPSPDSSQSPSPDSAKFLEDYRIDLTYSPWQLTPKEIESDLILNSREVADIVPNDQDKVKLKIVTEVLPNEMTLEEVYQKIALKKLNDYGTDKLGEYGNKILNKGSEKFTLADGTPAYKIIYSRFDGETNIKGMIVFTAKENPDNFIYILHYTGPVDQYDQHLSEAENIILSFKML